MKPVVVADAGPLIALAKLQQLELLLKLFYAVYLPNAVLLEITRDSTRKDAQSIQIFTVKHLKITGDSDDPLCDKLRKSDHQSKSCRRRVIVYRMSLFRQCYCRRENNESGHLYPGVF